MASMSSSIPTPPLDDISTDDEVNPAARPYETPIDTGKGPPIKSRVRYKGEWSVLVELPPGSSKQ
jgi:hypothetical protein